MKVTQLCKNAGQPRCPQIEQSSQWPASGSAPAKPDGVCQVKSWLIHLMTIPELMKQVFTRAPALRQLQGDTLAGEPRFAIGIYRAAVATGAMERVRLKRK
jgi:hypothetical protein